MTELVPVTDEMQEAYVEWTPPGKPVTYPVRAPRYLTMLRAAFFAGWTEWERRTKEAIGMAMSETQPSWGWRITRALSPLGLDYGDPDNIDKAIKTDVIRDLTMQPGATHVPVPKTAKELAAICRAWLDRDTNWGDWEQALDLIVGDMD